MSKPDRINVFLDESGPSPCLEELFKIQEKARKNGVLPKERINTGTINTDGLLVDLKKPKDEIEDK